MILLLIIILILLAFELGAIIALKIVANKAEKRLIQIQKFLIKSQIPESREGFD